MEEHTRALEVVCQHFRHEYVGGYFEAPQSPATRLSAELETQSRKRRAIHGAYVVQKKIQRIATRIIFNAQMSARIYRLN